MKNISIALFVLLIAGLMPFAEAELPTGAVASEYDLEDGEPILVVMNQDLAAQDTAQEDVSATGADKEEQGNEYRNQERTQAEVQGVEEVEEAEEAGVVKQERAQLEVQGGDESGETVFAENSNKGSDSTAKSTRKISKERLEEAAKNYLIHKQRVLDLKQNLSQRKQSIASVKNLLKACKDEECTQLETNIRGSVKEYLLETADLVLGSLEKVQSKVESSEDFGEEEAARIIANLEEKIKEVQDARAVVEELTPETPKYTIQQAIKTIKTAWAKTRPVLKKSTGRLLNENIAGIIVKSEQLETKLDRVVARLDEQGQNVTGLNELIEKFDASLEEAKQSYDKARELYLTPGETDEAMKQATAYTQEAHQKLKEAHQTLKEIITKIKETTGGSDALSESSGTEEPEAESETG